MKRIMIIVPKLSNGGTEKVAASLSYYLNKDKYDITFILFYNDKIDFEYKGKVIDLGLKSRSNSFSKLLINISRFLKIKKLKRKIDPHATISFESGPNILNVLTKENDRTILTVHFCKSEEKKDIYKKIYDYLIKKIYGYASHIVGVSRLIKHDLETKYYLPSNRVRAIYNFYDINKIQKLANEKLKCDLTSIFENNRVIINVGRLCYQKGQWHLIKAFKLLSEKYSDLVLVFLGIGEMMDELKSLSQKLGVESRVYFPGFTRNPFKYIAKSKIFAFPSMYEGFPNALVEALACESVIISSDCKSGPRELLEPGSNIIDIAKSVEECKYGILIPPFNKNKDITENIEQNDVDLSDAIIKLLNDNELYKKYKSRSLDRAKEFDGKKIIKQYEEIID